MLAVVFCGGTKFAPAVYLLQLLATSLFVGRITHNIKKQILPNKNVGRISCFTGRAMPQCLYSVARAILDYLSVRYPDNARALFGDFVVVGD